MYIYKNLFLLLARRLAAGCFAYNISFGTALLLLFAGNAMAQAPVVFNRWQEVNQGFAKCAAIGQSAGTATWQRDDFQILALFYKRSQAYAYIQYGNNASVTAGCSAGIFKHDTIANQWVKVAEDVPRAYGRYVLVNNDIGIWVLSAGRVYELTEDYTRYPTGWKSISRYPTDPLFNNQIYVNGGCSPSNSWETYPFGGGYEAQAKAINDTIYVNMAARETGTCPQENRVGKFCVTSGVWTFDVIGPFPDQLPGAPGGSQGGNSIGIVFTERIAGMFNYFYSYNYWGNSQCIPNYLWVYDPRPAYRTWRNISQGIDWKNQTGNSAPCTGGNNWGPAGNFVASWDRRNIYASSEQGIYKWNGSSWFYIGSYSGNSGIYPTTGGLFTINGGAGVNKLVGANYVPVDYLFDFYCVHNQTHNFMSPDDGRTLYAVKWQSKNQGNCGDETAISISRLKFDPDQPARVRNLHINTGTYLGGPGSNIPSGVGVGAGHRVYVAGTYDQMLNKGGAPYRTLNYNGATAASAGRVVQLNTRADSIRVVTNLGASVDDYAMQNYGDYRMAVSGSFGLSVLDSSGTQLWNVPAANIPGGGKIKIDINDQGQVAVLRAVTDNGGYGINTQAAVYAANGALLVPYRSMGTGQRYACDISIKGDTVMLVGTQQRDGELDYTACGHPVRYDAAQIQVCFVNTFTTTGGVWTRISTSFDFNGSITDEDLADTKLFRCGVGHDGKFYVLGMSAGGNTVFNWDGKQTKEGNGCVNPPNSPLVSTDNYNTNIMTSAPEYGYVAIINPATGYVVKSTFIIPRQNSGLGNTYNIGLCDVDADANGYVYIGGASASKLEGRDVLHINGQLIGDYFGGDMSVCIIDPSFRVRTFWGTFSTPAKAGGAIIGFGIRDNVVMAVGLTRGTSYTGSTHGSTFSQATALQPSPFNAASSSSKDTYLVGWYQDVWNHSNEDSLHERENPSTTVVPPGQFGYHADFTAAPLAACVGQPVVYTNRSVGDSANWKWSFGAGASLPAGTRGRGPWSVTYSTPGYKDARLDVTLKGNLPDYKRQAAYVNILSPGQQLSTITGPQVLCSGTEVIYSVTRVEGISNYTWQVPAGCQIVNGSGGPAIRVLSGGTGGNVTVYGTGPCGNTTVSSKQVQIGTPNASNILLVVGALPLSAGDQALKTRLTTNGYAVQTVVDSLSETANASCAAMVFISHTVRPAAVNFKFRDVGVPVITAHPGLFDNMALTNNTLYRDFGDTTGQNVQVLNNTHELGMTVALGSRPIYTANASINYGRNGGAAIIIAQNQGKALPALFAYDAGQQLLGSIAPARRVAFFADGPGLAVLTRDGQALFDRAVCWCMRQCTNPVTLATNVLASASYCPGDSILVPFTATGAFSSGTIPAVSPDLIYDDADRNVTYNGGWSTQTSPTGYYGSGYIRANAPEAWRYAAALPEFAFAGNYTVYMQFPASATNTASARVLVQYSGGADTVTVDQTSGSGFRAIGTWRFEAGASQQVRVYTKGRDGRFAVVDAFKFSPQRLDPVDPNVFFAELSDPNGNFTNPRQIGALNASASGTVHGLIPLDVLGGSRYRVRVTSTNPGKLGSDNGSNILIGGNPPTPGPIRGITEACQGQSVLTYTIDPVPGVQQYLWVTPLGTYIQGAPPESTNQFLTTSTRITVDFGGATTNEIKVYAQNRCGRSQNPSRLLVSLTGQPPVAPASIGGPDTVCRADRPVYAVPTDPAALHYQWQVTPASATTTDTSASATINLSALPNGTTLQIQVRAIGACGPSAWASRTVLVNDRAATPRISQITAAPPACAGQGSYSVDLVPGATAYTWTLPATATGSSTTNTISAFYATATTGTVSVYATTACGNTDTVSVPVNIPASGRQALLYVKTVTPRLGFPETSLKTELENEGYTVTLATPSTAINASTQCYRLIVISPNVNDGDNTDRLAQLPVPILACHSANGGDQLASLKMVPENRNGVIGSGWNTSAQVNIVAPSHPIAQGFNGLTTVYTNTPQMGWGVPTSAATIIATIPGQPTRAAIFAYDTGAQMVGQAAPVRRVGFFLEPNALIYGNAAGKTMFSQAVCWLIGGCPASVPTVTATASPTTNPVCPGGQINVPFTTTGVFDTANRFSVQLSDATGNFSPGLTLVGRSRTSPVSVTLPDTLTPGTRYKVRVLASVPAQTGPSSPGFTISGADIRVGVRGATVCAGQPARVLVVYGTNGASYQPILNGTAFGNPLLGAGDTLRVTIPYAALRGTGDTMRFTVMAGGCPARTLLAKAPIAVRAAPDSLLHLSDASVCPGQGARIAVDTSENGATYQPYLNGTAFGPPIAGTGSGFTIALTAGQIPTGQTNRLWLTASLPGCGLVRVHDTARITAAPAPSTSITAPNDTICAGGAATITLTGTEAGVRYLYQTGSLSDSISGQVGQTVIAIPASALATNPQAVTLQARAGTCPAVALSAAPGIYQREAPSANGRLLAPATACRGQVVRLAIAGTQAGATYTVRIGGQPTLTQNSRQSNDTLYLDLPTGAWPAAGSTISASATQTGCGTVRLADSTAIALTGGPQTGFTVSATRVCLGATATLQLSSSEAGVWYSVLLNGVALPDSAQGTGQALSITIPTTGLQPGVLSVSAASASCGRVQQADTAVLAFVPGLGARLSVPDDTVCPGSSHLVELVGTPGIGYALYDDVGRVDSTTASVSGQIELLRRAINAPIHLWVRAANACANQVISDTALISVAPSIDRRLTLPDLAFCTADQPSIQILNAQTGISYTPTLAGQPIGTATLGAGADLTIPITLPAGNGPFAVRVLAHSECGDSLLYDTALVRRSSGVTGRFPRPQPTVICQGSPYTLKVVGFAPNTPFALQNATFGTTTVDSTASDTLRLNVPTGAGFLMPGRNRIYLSSPQRGTCGTAGYLDSIDVYIGQPVQTNLRFLDGYSCATGTYFAYVVGSQAGIRYRPYMGNTPIAAALPGNGDTLRFTTTPAIRPGVSYIRIQAISDTCGTVWLDDSVRFVRHSVSRARFAAQQTTFCGTPTRLLAVGTDTGVIYNLAFNRFTTPETPATSDSLWLPISGPITAADTVAILSVSNPDCAYDTYLDTIHIRILTPPADSLPVQGSQYCAGGPVQVQLGTQAGIRYRLLHNGQIIDSVRGTGGTLTRTLATARYNPASDTVRIVAISPCGSTPLRQYAIVSAYPAPDTTWALSADTLCPGGTVRVTLSNPSAAPAIYTLVNAATGRVVRTLSAANPSAVLYADSLATGAIRLQVQAQAAPGCTVARSATRTLFVRTAPSVAGLTLLSDTICTGQDAQITLRGARAGQAYTLSVAGTDVDTATSTTGNLAFTVPGSGLTPGANPLQVYLLSPGCGRVPGPTATLYVNGTIDSTLTITGSTVCNADSGIVRIAASQPGVNYRLTLNGAPVGRTKAGTGDTLIFKVGQNLYVHDTIEVGALAQNLCGSIALAGKATLIRLRRQVYKSALRTEDSLVCLNTVTTFTLVAPNAYALRWRAPKHTTHVLIPGSNAIQLTYVDYPNDRDSISVSASLPCGGSVTALRVLKRPPSCQRLAIPNIFTPNSQDGNRTWDIRGLEVYASFTLTVFNQWGAQVWQAKNAYTQWDGKAGGTDLPTGTYYYVLDLGNKSAPETGSVTIFR